MQLSMQCATHGVYLQANRDGLFLFLLKLSITRRALSIVGNTLNLNIEFICMQIVWWHISAITCQFYIGQVDIIIWQVDIIIWQVDKMIWQVDIITKKSFIRTIISTCQIMKSTCQIFMLTCQILSRLVR